MFEHDPHSLKLHFPHRPVPGGVAPMRRDLQRQAYLDAKRARLSSEAAERRRQDREAQGAADFEALTGIAAAVKRCAGACARLLTVRAARTRIG